MENNELTIVSADGCGHCEKLKRILAGKVRIVDCFDNMDKAVELLQKVQSDGVPTAIREKNGRAEKCKILFGENDVEIHCSDKKYHFVP